MAETYKGVYSTQDLRRRGVSVPGQAAQKRYWIAWQDDAGFRVQPLSSSFEPLGGEQRIGNAEFSARFSHEPEVDFTPPATDAAPAAKKGIKIQSVTSTTKTAARKPAAPWDQSSPAEPAKRTQSATQPASPAKPQQPSKAAPKKKAFDQTQVQSPNWVRLDEELAPPVAKEAPPEVVDDPAELSAQLEKTMRADFAMALARLRVGQRERAVSQIETLLAVRGTEDPSFRHMFTEFGINLRKAKLPEIALRTHLEARRLSPKDSHILFNAARAAYDLGDITQTRSLLEEALYLSPDLEPAQRFLDFLSRKKAK